MYNPNVPSSNMGIAPISGQPSQPLGPAPMVGSAPMGPPPPMAPPMMAPPPMAPPIAPITEGLGGFGGSSAGRAGFSERMQQMTAPPKPKPMSQPVQRMSYGGMVGQAALPGGMMPAVPPMFQTVMPRTSPVNPFSMPQAPKISEQYQPYQNFGMPQQGSANALNQYGEYLDDQYGDPQFEQKRDNFLQGIAQREQQTFGDMGGYGGQPTFDFMQRERSLLDGIYGSGGLSNYQVAGARPMANGGSVPRRTEISGQPHMLAYIDPQEERLLRGLGGSGQPGPGGVPAYAREDGPGSDNFGTAASKYGYGSSGNSSDSSYEDEAYGDDGYGRVDYGGGDSGGDGDDYSDVPVVNLDPDDLGHLEPVLIGDQPPPEPASGGDDIKDRVIADLVYGPADPTIGPNNAKEALDQANAEIKAGRGDVADLTLATLASRIGRGSNVMPARLSDIAAISQDFAVPPPEDTTFSDPDEIFNLRNPISLNAAQVVGPNSRTDASGNLIPGRADTKADIEAGTEAARFEPAAPEVMSFDPSIGGSGSNLIGLGPSAFELGFDDSIKSPVPVTTTLADAATFTPTLGGGFGELGGRGQLSVDEDVFSTLDPTRRRPDMLGVQPSQPNLVRAGSSARRGILGPKEDVNLGNAMAAAEAVDSGTRQNIADSFNNRSIRESEIGGRDDLARNQMLGGLLEMNTPEGEARMRAAARRAEILGMPADQQAAVTAYPLISESFNAPAGDTNPFIGITDVEAAANSAPPSDIQLEVAPYNSGNLTSGDIADLLVNTPGLTEYALTRGSSASPGTPATGLTKGAGSGFNRPTDGPVVKGPDGQILSQDQVTKLNQEYRDDAGSGVLSKLQADTNNGMLETLGPERYAVGDPLTGTGINYDPGDAKAMQDRLTQIQLDGMPKGTEFNAPSLDGNLSVRDVALLNNPNMGITGKSRPLQTEDVVSAEPAQTVPVPADPDGGGKIVPAKDYAESDYKSPGVLDDYVDPYEDQFVKDSYEQQLFGDPPKTVQAFGGLVKLLSGGLIDINKLTAEHRRKGLKAYLETNELAYENGVVVGVKDPEGRTIYLGPQSPKEEDDTGGDDDGCPPGFRRINGVCMPIRQNRVAANPATAISDSINKATLPSTLRPVVRDVVDDEDEEETSDVGGLTIRRPKYFANGGAVSEGMGSAIDSFISAMGGSVKKKSDVEPVNMFLGGLVDRFTGRNDYTDPYEELERDYGYDPTDPFGDGDTSYGDDSPSDTVTSDTFIGPMQPNVTYQPPVDTGGDDKPVKALGFQFDPRNANITGLPEIEDFMQRKSAEPYRSEQYIYNEMNPLNKGDITEGLEDNDFLMPEFMRGPLMIGNQYKTSVPQAAIDMGGEFFNTVKEDPLGVLGDAAVGLGKGAFDFLYNPPQTVWNAAKGIYESVTDLGTETNARDRLGNIIGTVGIVPGTRALQVAGRPVANAVDAAQTAQAANFQSAISGTPVPNTGGIMNPRIETNLDRNESMLAQRTIGNAEQDLRSGMSAPEVMAKHDVAVYPQKNAAGETTGHEVMYRFDADRFKYDEEKFAKLPVGEQITLDDVTIESPFKNMGSDIQKNVTLENQKETRIGNLIKGIKEGRGPAGFFDNIHGGIARKTGTGTQIINYNEPQPNLIPHEILHATEQRALNRGLRDAMTGGGSQSKGRRINERIDDLKAQMKAGFPEVGSLEMRMAKMQDAKQEIAALKNISPEAAYMNNVLETYARSAEGGVDRLGVYDMTRLEALNPKINQANILKRMAQGLGGKDSRAKYVPMTYEMIQGLNPVTTRADALTRGRFNNP